MAKKFSELSKRMPAKAQAEVKVRVRKMLKEMAAAERKEKIERVRAKPALHHEK
jgi:hypothetical protein